MAKKISESPFQALEETALQAYREWPIWLVLRLRELHGHLDTVTRPEPRPRSHTDEPAAR